MIPNGAFQPAAVNAGFVKAADVADAAGRQLSGVQQP
jgi:hypothetical protein